MKRRDFAISLLLAGAVRTVRAQEPAKQRRIAIVIPAGPVAQINDRASRYWQPFWEELRRLGDAEGHNLIVEAYSGGGRPAGYADLAREVTGRNPDVIIAITGPVALAIRAATGTIPIVWIGVDPIGRGLVTSLAHPGENITGVSLFDYETYAKRLQILNDTIPMASKVAFLSPRRVWESGQALQRALQDVGRRLDMSVIPMLIEESTPSEYQRVFAEIAPERADGLIHHRCSLAPTRSSNEKARFHDRSAARSGSANSMGARGRGAAPNWDCPSRRTSDRDQRHRSSLLSGVLCGAAAVGRCRGAKPLR